MTWIPSASRPINLHAQIQHNGGGPWIVHSHGVGEHLGRHSYWPSLLPEGFNLCQYDLRGHGRSQGQRGYIEDFQLFIDDLECVIQYLQEKQQASEFILAGHSMGSLITWSFLQCKEHIPKKVFINAPPIGVGGPLGPLANRLSESVYSKLSLLPLSWGPPGLVDLAGLSHNPQVKEDFLNDELTNKAPSLKLFFEMMKHIGKTFASPFTPKCPCLVTWGSTDPVIDPSSLKEYFDQISNNIESMVFEGAFHEIHHEDKQWSGPFLEKIKEFLKS
jgi:acylglycerol lipase